MVILVSFFHHCQKKNKYKRGKERKKKTYFQGRDELRNGSEKIEEIEKILKLFEQY